jgi:hypothetical protein
MEEWGRTVISKLTVGKDAEVFQILKLLDAKYKMTILFTFKDISLNYRKWTVHYKEWQIRFINEISRN